MKLQKKEDTFCSFSPSWGKWPICALCAKRASCVIIWCCSLPLVDPRSDPIQSDPIKCTPGWSVKLGACYLIVIPLQLSDILLRENGSLPIKPSSAGQWPGNPPCPPWSPVWVDFWWVVGLVVSHTIYNSTQVARGQRWWPISGLRPLSPSGPGKAYYKMNGLNNQFLTWSHQMFSSCRAMTLPGW